MPKFLKTGNAMKSAGEIVEDEREERGLNPEQWRQLFGFRWGKPKRSKESADDMRKLIEFLWK